MKGIESMKLPETIFGFPTSTVIAVGLFVLALCVVVPIAISIGKGIARRNAIPVRDAGERLSATYDFVAGVTTMPGTWTFSRIHSDAGNLQPGEGRLYPTGQTGMALQAVRSQVNLSLTHFQVSQDNNGNVTVRRIA
jgi:hypothetical protein